MVARQEPSKTNKNARQGPGYKWEFTTENQENTNEYYVSSSGDRYYFFKGSRGYTRSVTLTVTKTSTSTSNPSFRVYTGADQCVTISALSASSGSTQPTSFYESGFDSRQYTGYSWSVPLGSSPVGTTATLTFNFSSPYNGCTEGYIKADMTSPGLIRSASSYWDLDYLYAVRNSNI
jgi:hypothetical protein